MFFLRLILRNALRYKLRTSLTVLSVAVAVLAFGILTTMTVAWFSGVKSSSAYRLITRNSVSLVIPLPVSYKESIRRLGGVKSVTYANWFGGIYKNERNFFASYAVEPETYLNMYPEFVIPYNQKADFIRERKACMAGRALADKFGWKVGDVIALRGTLLPGDWEFVLRGIYEGKDKYTNENQFFFHWDYRHEKLKALAPHRADHVGIFIVELTGPEMAGAVSAGIDSLFKNSYAATLTEPEKSFQMGFVFMTEAVLKAISIVSALVIFIIIAIVANTMSMSVRARITEYAVMKTLGFSAVHIAALIFAESLLLTLTGGIIGICLTFPSVKLLGENISSFLPALSVVRETVWLDLASALFIGMSAAVIPAWHSARQPAAAGLRRIV